MASGRGRAAQRVVRGGAAGRTVRGNPARRTGRVPTGTPRKPRPVASAYSAGKTARRTSARAQSARRVSYRGAAPRPRTPARGVPRTIAPPPKDPARFAGRGKGAAEWAKRHKVGLAAGAIGIAAFSQRSGRGTDRTNYNTSKGIYGY